jgi:hypothetical protein
MAKIRNPVSFSEHFRIAPAVLANAGAFDPILNADSQLFIDPLLLQSSAVSEAQGGAHRLRKHFEDLLRLLSASKTRDDLPWRIARKLMQYREVAATCLGYGKSTAGSALGRQMTESLLATAKEMIDLGIRDPEIFLLLPFLEEGIGPDRVSDITTNIILPDLATFTQRVLSGHGLPVAVYEIRGSAYSLPSNPYARGPVLLVPDDVLRTLPIATDWDGVAAAAAHNEALRTKVNMHVAEILKNRTERDKAVVRQQAKASKEALQALLETVRAVPRDAYNMAADPLGISIVAKVAGVAQAHPLSLSLGQTASTDEIWDVVRAIVEQFRHLVEDRDLWRLLWHGTEPRRESAAQMLFFAVASSYCSANNLDLTPEAETGRGPVDFKISSGHDGRFLVEVKLSTNSRIVHGYTTQLELYRKGESVERALFLVVDVGDLGDKDQKLLDARSRALIEGKVASEIMFINGQPRASASKAAEEDAYCPAIGLHGKV